MPIIAKFSDRFIFLINKTSVKIPFHTAPNIWSFVYSIFWNTVYAYIFAFLLSIPLRLMIWDEDVFHRLQIFLVTLVFVYFEEFYLWSLSFKLTDFLKNSFKWSFTIIMFEFLSKSGPNFMFFHSWDLFFVYLLIRTPASLVHFARVASAYFGLKKFPKYSILFFLAQMLVHYSVNIGYNGWPIPAKKIAEINIVAEREKETQDLKFKEFVENYKKSRGLH